MRFGETARGICRRWLIAAAAVVFAAFTAMLVLGVISPLGVQGADQSIDDNGQAVDFQPTMVTDVSVTNTNQGPGEVSGYRFQFTTPDALTANEDAITVHFDKDFRDLHKVLSRDNVTVSAMASSGSATTDASGPSTTGAYIPYSDATREILTTGKHGLSNSAALNNVEYTFYVPDMNGDIEGAPGIAAGATVSVHVSPGAGIRNPTEGGSKGPIGVFTSMQSMMDTSLKITVDRTLQLSDYDANRNKSLTIIGKGFQNGTNATIYLDNANGTRQALVSVLVANDDTFQVTFTVTVPPFVPGKGNWLYAEDGNQPPLKAGPVGFEVEGLLTVSPTSAAVGDEVDITLEDWPDGPIPANAVTIAGVTQRIIGSPSVSGNSASFRIEISTDTPSGVNEIKVTANGESDVKKITITDTFSPDPGSVAGDRAALVALYNATDGANWTNNSGWLTDAPVYEWYGVTVDPEFRVDALDLHSNGLSGQIPAELGSLTNLRRLGLSVNRLSGEIPPELGSLAYLSVLDLSGNLLTGSIPPELGNLANLQLLRFSGNQLTGCVPAGLLNVAYNDIAELGLPFCASEGDVGDKAALVALYNATDGANWWANSGWLTEAPLSQWHGVEADNIGRVTGLHLSFNRLTGEIPAELGNLTNLTELDLNHNQLSGEIPAELGSLTNLTGLDLSHNQLSSEIPAELGSLTTLEALSLYHNRLSGEIPESLGGLTNLVELYLSDNQLSGEIPGSLGGLVNLKHLSLGRNELSGEIPAGLGNLAGLRSLDLSKSRLSGEIPVELGGLSHLQLLRLDNNQLRGGIPTELASLASLQSLYLTGNQLTGTIPAELGSLASLQSLGLSRNQLTGTIPAELGSLASLRSLGLSRNQLSGEIPTELSSLARLASLDLSGNQLSGEIPAELGSLVDLGSLRLDRNQLSGEIPKELGNLTNLAWLELYGNRLTGEMPTELGNLASLGYLDLSGNRLSGEIPAELGSLTNLTTLELNDNQLSGGIPEELGSLTNLEILRLSSNRLTGCVPASLRGVAIHDLAELGLPFCDMLDGSPVVVVRFVSEAGAPVRLGSPVSLEATFSEPVAGFSLEDVSVANGVAGNFAGSGAVYTFDVTPNAIGEVAVDVAAGVAEDADGKGNIEARLSLGIPYDDDGDGMISKREIIAAINDYLFDEIITKAQVIALISLYLFG